MNTAFIKEIGLYFPEQVYTNEMLLSDFPDLKVNELTRLTGVKQRHICAPYETSVDMGVNAAENLFQQNEIDRLSIDYLIFCSAGGDYITPASACVVHDKLGLKPECGTVDINQGCTGFIHGFSLANGLISASTAENVLLITSEAISKTVHNKDKGNRAIFGDAAAATLISKSEKKHLLSNCKFGTDGSKFDKIIIKHGRERFPLPEFAEEDFVDALGTVRNNSKIYMNGSEVFSFSIEKAPGLINALLNEAGMEKDDVDYFIFHQSNRIVPETIARKMNLPMDKVVIELENTGNTISSSIPIALKNSMEKGLIKRGDKIVFAAFGVGFSWGGFILEL